MVSWSGFMACCELIRCPPLWLFPFWESFRSGAMDSMSALRDDEGGRVETRETTSSVLLASTYGRVCGGLEHGLMLWS